MIKELGSHEPKHVLDIATGTADLAIETQKRLEVDHVTGIDLSAGMLSVGDQKIAKNRLESKIDLIQADAENLPFEDAQFDAAMVAFGVRNFENLQAGLKDIRRVLKPGAPFYILEFSKPKHFPIKQGYAFYCKYVLPKLGSMISGDENAYKYLPASVNAFPEDQNFLNELDSAGFRNSRQRRFTFGICSMYCGIK